MKSFKEVSTLGKIARIGFVIFTFIAIYLMVCGASLGIGNWAMHDQIMSASNFVQGYSRLDELKDRGVQVEHHIYDTDEDYKQDTVLYYFPSDNKISDDYVIVCPGGGYQSCEKEGEGYPVAAEINKLGYTAFVLKYRVGEHSKEYAPIEDLANAVKYIQAHSLEFFVNPDKYACVGFSAGGSLIGLFGSEDLGYKKYNVTKPSFLMMGYPWCNQNDFSLNIFKAIGYHNGNENGAARLIHPNPTQEEKENMKVTKHITKDYPMTYIMHGKSDITVPYHTHSDVLYELLQDNNVKSHYELLDGVHHGCGLGLGTKAEGWISRALEYWKTNAR